VYRLYDLNHHRARDNHYTSSLSNYNLQLSHNYRIASTFSADFEESYVYQMARDVGFFETQELPLIKKQSWFEGDPDEVLVWNEVSDKFSICISPVHIGCLANI
jgi:hypothetical protein